MDNMKFEDKINEFIEQFDSIAKKAKQNGFTDEMNWYNGKAEGLRLALKLFNDSLTTLEKLGRNLD